MRTDAQLMAAARTDAGAFRQLYDRHSTAIHRFHLGRSRNPDAALDLTAETFAQAWLSRERFRDLAGGSAGPWLYGIARHVLLASVRRHELERSASERLGLLARSDHAEPEVEWLDGLDEALAALSPELEEAVRLRIVDDLSYDDVARAAGTTPGAARVRVHRGLTSLRRRVLKEAPNEQ